MLSLPAIRPVGISFPLLIVIMQMGCATTATMTTLKPAEIDLHGVQRIAVLDVRGPDEPAELARETVASQLHADGGFAVVPSRQLSSFTSAPLYYQNGNVNRTAALQAAARAGLDAVLIGQLTRHQEGMFALGGSNVQIGDPTVTVRFDFQLVDARTGNVLATGAPEESYKGELDRYGNNAPSEEKILRQLAESCARQVAGKIAPHRVPVQIRMAAPALGRGATAVWAGNALARKGDWQTALQRWSEALDDNPDSHAAAYNLGLAYESMDDYATASRMYQLAAELDDKDLYVEALSRMDGNARQYQLAMSQVARHNQPSQHPQQRLASRPIGWKPREEAASYTSPPSDGRMRRLPPPE